MRRLFTPTVRWVLSILFWLALSVYVGPLSSLISLAAGLLIMKVWSHLKKIKVFSPRFFLVSGLVLLVMAILSSLLYPHKTKVLNLRVSACLFHYSPKGQAADKYGIFASKKTATPALTKVCNQVDIRGGLDKSGFVAKSFAIPFCGVLAGEDYDLRLAQGQKAHMTRLAYEKIITSRCVKAITK